MTRACVRCERPARARGLCIRHYRKAKDSGLFAELNIPCAVEECADRARAGGLCNRHYLRSRRHGNYAPPVWIDQC